MTVEVLINAHPFKLEAAQDLQTALARFGANEPFVVAVNEQFVPRSHYAQHQLEAGDRIEILNPIQGG